MLIASSNWLVQFQPIKFHAQSQSYRLTSGFCCFGSFSGVHNYGPEHLDEAVAFLARTCKKYPYEELFSEPFKLTDFETALELSKQQTFYRVCMKP